MQCNNTPLDKIKEFRKYIESDFIEEVINSKIEDFGRIFKLLDQW